MPRKFQWKKQHAKVAKRNYIPVHFGFLKNNNLSFTENRDHVNVGKKNCPQSSLVHFGFF